MTAWAGAMTTSVAACASHTGGLLTHDTHAPLTLHGCEVRVVVRGYSALVTLRHEYVNDSAHNHRVVALHPLPLTWQLMSCEVAYTDDKNNSDNNKRCVTTHYTTRQQPQPSLHTPATATVAAPLWQQTEQQQQQQQLTRCAADTTACVCAVQHVPWTLLLDSSMLLTSTYLVHLLPSPTTATSAQHAHRFCFALPAELLQMLHTHGSSGSSSGGGGAYARHFALQSPSPRTLSRGLVVHVTGELATPLRGHVTLHRRCYACSCDGTTPDDDDNDDDEDNDDERDEAVASATARIQRVAAEVTRTTTTMLTAKRDATAAAAKALPCHVDYTGDSCFALQYHDANAALRPHWPYNSSSSHHTDDDNNKDVTMTCCACGRRCGLGGYGELQLRCRVGVSDEPLRLFATRLPSNNNNKNNKHGRDASDVALAICLAPRLRRCDVNVELVLVLDAHAPATACAAAEALRCALPTLPPSVRVNVVLAGNALRHATRCARGQVRDQPTPPQQRHNDSDDDDDDGCVYRDGSRRVCDVAVDALCALVRERAMASLVTGHCGNNDDNSDDTTTPATTVSTKGSAEAASRLPAVLRQVWTCTGSGSCGVVPSGYVRHVVLLSDTSVRASNARVRDSDDSAIAALFAEVARQTTSTRLSAIALCHDASDGGNDDCSSNDDDNNRDDGRSKRDERVTTRHGTHVDTTLLRLLAREGGGVYACATSASHVLRALVRVLHAAATVPSLTRVRVHCHATTATGALPASPVVRTAFAHHDSGDGSNNNNNNDNGSCRRHAGGSVCVPVVAEGEVCCLYALADATTATQVTVHITGSVGDATIEYVGACRVPPPPPPHADDAATSRSSLLHYAAAAAARIAYVSEQAACATCDDDDVVDEVASLSCALSLPSPFTQLVQQQQQQQQHSSDNNNRARDKAYGLPAHTSPVVVQAWHNARAWSAVAALRRGRAAQPPPSPTTTKTCAQRAATVVPHRRAHMGDGDDEGSSAHYARALLWRVVAHVTRSSPDARALLALQQLPAGVFVLDRRLALQLRRCAQHLRAASDASKRNAAAATSTTSTLDALFATLCAQQPPSCPSRTAWATALALTAMTLQWPALCALARRAALRALQRACARADGDGGVADGGSNNNSGGRDGAHVWHDWLDAATRQLLCAA